MLAAPYSLRAVSTDDKTKHPRRPWRDNLEALTMAIVMAVMLKYFVVEAYKIPTGSMQPTLLGNDETGVFDRILVDKLSFHFRDPERFEVCVFKYPLDRSKTFIKRVCGMPGEEFAIRHGDLWTRPDAASDWQVLRRPRPVQEEIWRGIDANDPRFASWRPIDGTKGWTSKGRAHVEARGDGAVRVPNDLGPIWDSYRDGYTAQMSPKLVVPAGGSNRNQIGDVRIAGTVRALEGTRMVTVELREGGRRYAFELPGPAALADAKPRIHAIDANTPSAAPGQAFGASPWRLAAGAEVAFAAQNMDDRLELEIDGETVATLDIASAPDQAASITLRVEGAGADFDDLELARDIYYTEGSKGREYKIPAGHYVMLGDNTQNSSDSREWQFVKFRWPGEGSEGALVRGNHYPPQNPVLVTGDPRGTQVFLRDEWGELHDFFSPPGERDSSLEAAPYVARELVIGRAVVVFWPQTILSKVLGSDTPLLWRLSWIH